ncbi:MAG: class A beta-lactamase [Planctomycetota bacterium]
MNACWHDLVGRVLTVACLLLSACASNDAATKTTASLRMLERQIGGRLGVAVVQADGRPIALHRGDERFAMCSTFKVLLAAAFLEEVAQGALSLDEEIPFTRADLVPYTPVVGQHLDRGRLPIERLCRAAVQVSDNVAANLLLRRLGGPVALTSFCRRHGDAVTRLDRYECDLNENVAGDLRDTTTPLGIANSLALHLYSERESKLSGLLRRWMAGTRTGKDRLRAGVPSGWAVGNKTGTATHGSPIYSDIAFVEPPGRLPLVLAVYCDRPTADRQTVEAAIAEVARICVAADLLPR